MQALSSEALPLPATPKGVTKRAFIYVKRVKAKNSVISYLRVLFIVMCLAKHAKRPVDCCMTSYVARGHEVDAMLVDICIVSAMKTPCHAHGECIN